MLAGQFDPQPVALGFPRRDLILRNGASLVLDFEVQIIAGKDGRGEFQDAGKLTGR